MKTKTPKTPAPKRPKATISIKPAPPGRKGRITVDGVETTPKKAAAMLKGADVTWKEESVPRFGDPDFDYFARVQELIKDCDASDDKLWRYEAAWKWIMNYSDQHVMSHEALPDDFQSMLYLLDEGIEAANED